MLTGKQEKFCQCIADGMTQADAYRTAYNAVNMKPESVQVKACELTKDGKISVRVAELKSALEKKQLWTREKSVKALINAYKVAEDAGNAAAMTGSIKELNAMHGYNAPSKVDLSSSDGSMSPPKRVEISFVDAASQATE
jgi:phage terminase small subunit